MNDPAADPETAAPRLSEREAEELVLRLIADHADSLLRFARRYSICADDAQDAYQRSLEILMRHARRLDPERAASWLRTVVKHEALALNRTRRRIVGSAEVDLDRYEGQGARTPEEAVISFERVERSAAALRQLKPQELRALWLKALGYSYAQICEQNQWTYTKTNRCITEGRKSFMERYAGIEAGEECERLAPALSALVDGEGKPEALVELRAHLRHCLTCRATVRHLHETSDSLAVVFPIAGLMVADVAEPASHFAVRVYETVVMALNERAANSLLRAQAVIEVASGAKLATVAASAVAMTGGGVAVQQVVSGGELGGTPPAALRQSGIAAARPPAASASSPSSSRKATSERPRRRDRRSGTTTAQARATTTPTQTSAGAGSATTASTSTSAAPTTLSGSATGPSDFSFEGG